MFEFVRRRARRGGSRALLWVRNAGFDYFLTLLLGCLLTGWLAWSLMAYMDSKKFDSGWVKVDNKTSKAIRIPHNLDQAPKELTLWFSPTVTGEPAYLVTQWTIDTAGNPVTISADRSAITLMIYHGVPLRGVWSPEAPWKLYTEGYYKVVAK
jgi:hypothetical protein